MSNMQAEGVIPASTHTLHPYCSESDLPAERIKRITDVPLGWLIAAATDLLYVLTQRKYRSGRSVVRPTARFPANQGWWYNYPWSSMSGYGSGWGYAAGWAWSSVGLGFWQGQSSDLSTVVLQAPVLAIHEVLLNGQPLAPTDYTLYNRRDLVLTIATESGEGTGNAWPWEQVLAIPATQPGTAQIDYSWGIDPPEIGRMACAELAIQLGLAFTGANDCRLPTRVLTVATEGVSVAVGDALTYIREKLTGLPICDMWIQAENPQKAQRRSMFAGPNTYLNHTV